MGTHPKPKRYRLKLLLFLVNAPPAPPIPRLVHKRPVGRVHQSNNTLVHMRRKLASQMRNPVFLAENTELRRQGNLRCQAPRRGGACPSLRLSPLIKTRSIRRDPSSRAHENPNIPIALFARIMSG